MKRTFRSFPVTDFLYTKQQMLSWADQFNICCFLDDHGYHMPGHVYECILAVGARHTIATSFGTAYQQLNNFLKHNQDWCFGHLGYDLKNETEELVSNNPDYIGFPDLFFFIPETIVILKRQELLIGVYNETHRHTVNEINHYTKPSCQNHTPIEIKSRFSKSDYVETVGKIKRHIVRGDCYELNFCQEFYNDNAIVSPLQLYRALSKESPNPFSGYYKHNQKYLLCASPERYVKKAGKHIISQPIKGTVKRNNVNEKQDLLNRNSLINSAKDRSENVMIVDLVRNDLSKICEEGTVKVDELFGVYTFPQVYQMISTISGKLKEEIGITDIFKATFPMGSMTGAPKKKVMELIETFEKTRRGLFSGAIGYITPEGDLDFNVIIRSILYNSQAKYLSFQTGSAITYNSDADSEYEECLLKAEAIKKVLQHNQSTL